MMTFACAVQSITQGKLQVSFETDPADTSRCRLVVGDPNGERDVLTFQRNGFLLGIDHIEPEAESPELPTTDVNAEYGQPSTGVDDGKGPSGRAEEPVA